MNVNIEYKVFESLQDFEKYLVTSEKFTDRFDNVIYYWDSRHTIRRRRVNKKNNNNFEPSDIKYYVQDGDIIYFYIKDDGVCCLIVCGYRSELETKLYHLTHGPKALSIPDAFKVLSL